MKSLSLAAALAFVAAFTAVAQRPSNRQVDDELLREGSRNGEEWVSYAVNLAFVLDGKAPLPEAEK
jgi:hypothetical protein